MSPTTEETQIIVRGGELIRQTVTTVRSEQKLGLIEEALAQKQKPVCFIIRKAFKVSQNPVDIICHSTGGKVVVVPLEGIPWKQYYQKHTGEFGYQYPLYLSSGWQTPLHASEAERYELKSDMLFKRSDGIYQPYLFINYTPGGQIPGTISLLIYDVASKELHVPPLPNVFTDGRMCMGRDFDNNPGGGMFDLAGQTAHVLRSFAGSIWNNHLLHGRRSELVAAFCPTKNQFVCAFNPVLISKQMVLNAPQFLGTWKPN